jgi:hypothetical protein
MKANNKKRLDLNKAHLSLKDGAIREIKIELENFRSLRKEQKEREEKIKEFEQSRLGIIISLLSLLLLSLL